MDLVDDPSSPNIIALFELPGVKNENITLQIKDRRLVVAGNRVDPYSEALAAATSTVSGPQTQVPPRTSSTEISQIDPSAATAASSGSISSPSLTNRSVRELRYGSFFRSIPVPDGIKVRFVLSSPELFRVTNTPIQQSEVNAGIQDGILTVTWPRVPASARQSVLQMTSVTGGNTSMNPVTSKATPGAEGTGLNNTMAMVQ